MSRSEESISKIKLDAAEFDAAQNSVELKPSHSAASEQSAWIKSVLIVSALTVTLALYALFIRSTSTDNALSFKPLQELTLSAYHIGLYAREIAVPLILLFLLSRFRLFQRVTTSTKPARKDLAIITVVLIAIQVAVHLLTVSQIAADQDSMSLGVFVPFAAGLLGGWRVGLISGVVGMISEGLHQYFLWGYDGSMQFGNLIEYNILKNSYSAVILWVGPTTGLLSEALRLRHRLKPITVFGVALLFQAIMLLCIYIATDNTGYFVERMIPYIVVFGLAALSIAMMIQSVQNDTAQHQIETTKLTLAETQLDLTQTKLALTQAELRALHAQINPHFFFNSLNTIRYFIRTDPDTARDLLTKLSDIFQRVLSAGESISLREEIEQVEAYLGLEKARLEDRLQVIWTNLSSDLNEQQIPPLILQPIVENAVIHGISPNPDGGTIHIVINQVNDELMIQVTDDGMGFDPTATPEENPEEHPDAISQNERPSLGLQNVDDRLRMLYGDDHRLTIQSQPAEGTRVIMRLPLNSVTTE